MAGEALEVIERLAVGAVAVTERAIAAAGSDLTFVQWRVLMIVGERPDGESIADIARRIGARASPASRLISRLRHRGVVRTSKDLSDARITRVQLTRSGEALRTRVLDARRELLAEAVTEAVLDSATVWTIKAIARALERFA